ncbi:MAG: MerR family transcriptional regulator [Cetobacterium sp.]
MIFSIGETAKLTQVTIQTLRHYDKEGLLKPSFVHEETNYRYYSIDQFQQIDFIKRCKALGFSLEKIKSILYEENSLENILDSITFQKYVVQLEIEKLQKIGNDLAQLENNLEHAIEKLNKTPEVEKISFYVLGRIEIDMKNMTDIETSIRSVLKRFKTPYSTVDSFIVLKVEEGATRVYKELIIASKSIETSSHYFSDAISLYTESGVFQNDESFSKIKEFSIQNNITLDNSYFELYYISKLDEKNKEFSLINIFSPISKIN